MRLFLTGALALVSVTLPIFGQLTTAQKVLDFQQLAALYAKQYAPYGWKLETYKYDLFDLKPWIERINRTKDDLAFYEICSEYVASLNDAHSAFSVPSTFVADTGLRVDIYEGKYIIDDISRTRLPRTQYPFEVGDEVVSIDGKSPAEWVDAFKKFEAFANERSTARWVAHDLGVRVQAIIPSAGTLGETSEWVIRRRDGNVETYNLKWNKSGRALTSNGPVPTPSASVQTDLAEENPAQEPVGDSPTAGDDTPQVVSKYANFPAYSKAWMSIARNMVNRDKTVALRGFGSKTPTFTIPNFTQRLGRSSADYFFTGTFKVGNYTIGFMRIPDFYPSSISTALSQFDREIAFFQTSTDGLVIDVMRNPGGYGCLAEEYMTRLNPNGFTSMGFSVRATLSWANEFYDSVEQAKAFGAEQWQIDLLQAYVDAIEDALKNNRGDTGPLPFCAENFDREVARDISGRPFAYDKPLIVLTDEFTTSAGDIFAALMQDAGRGPLVGWRTAGAGGNVSEFNVGFYSEAMASVTQSMMMRPRTVKTPDFPDSRFIENIGVRPDIQVDYMTLDNLLRSGAPYVEAFSKVIGDLVTASRQ